MKCVTPVSTKKEKKKEKCYIIVTIMIIKIKSCHEVYDSWPVVKMKISD